MNTDPVPLTIQPPAPPPVLPPAATGLLPQRGPTTGNLDVTITGASMTAGVAVTPNAPVRLRTATPVTAGADITPTRNAAL